MNSGERLLVTIVCRFLGALVRKCSNDSAAAPSALPALRFFGAWQGYAFNRKTPAVRRLGRLATKIGEKCGLRTVATVFAFSAFAAAPPGFGSVLAGIPKPGETEREITDPHARTTLKQVNTELGVGAWRTAAHHAEEAVAVAREADDVLLEAECLQALGNALFHLERYQEALLAFRHALTLAEGHGEPFLEALLLKDVGITEKLLGEYDRAILHLELATEREPGRRTGPMAVSILGNLGSLYQQLGAHQLALTTYEDAITVARRLGDIRGEIDCLARISGLYLVLGQAERALEFLEPALDLEVAGVSEGDASCRGWLLGMATEAYSRTGRRDLAITRSNELLAMWRKAGNRAQESLVLSHQGWLTVDDDLVEAETLFAKALEVADGIGPSDTLGALSGLAEIAIRRGELDTAIAHYSSAVEQAEERRSGLTSAHQRVVFTDVNLTVYHHLVEALLERSWRTGNTGDTIRAFHVLEQARARVLAEALAENRLQPGHWLPPELAARETSTQRRLRKLVARLTEPGATDHGRSELLEKLEKAELEADAVVESIRRSHPHFASLHYPEPLSVQGTQALLDRRTALLSYLVTEDRAYAFVVTTNGLAVEELPATAAGIAARVSNAHDLLTMPPGDGWTTVGERLARELVEPVRHHLGPEIEALIVAPDGPLHALPFEALPSIPDRARGGLRFLLDDYEISYTPSATVLAELQRLGRRRCKQEPGDALVFANPEVTLGEPDGQAPATMAERIWRLYQEDGFTLGPLPSSSAEAAVVAGYAGPESAIHVGREATEARIKGEKLDRFDILHFATHGLVTPAAAARSALVLAPGDPGEDGFLQAREIAKLRVNATLVVLSACRTAQGRRTPSEGVQSLARAFITAGASSVVCTLWDVDDAQAAQLIAAFYGHLGGGMGKAGALRAAKLECLRSRGRCNPPATWASFVLIGEAGGGVPLKAPPDGRLGRASLISIALTAAAAALVLSAWARRS